MQSSYLRGLVGWHGSWKEGAGTLSTASPILHAVPYTYTSRFEGAPGGNPEELLATAYAGCLTQAFANTLGWGNYTVESLETTVQVTAELGPHGAQQIHIILRAKVPGIQENQFQGLVTTAKTGCLISRLLKIEATMEATLV